jgi:hypothetical protein
MPPTARFVSSFAAEPPQAPLPSGEWAAALAERFRAACAQAEAQADAGAPGEVAWYPDRTWNGRTYVPATAPSEHGWEYFGYVAFAAGEGEGGGRPADVFAAADLTEETASRNPDWQLDLSDEVIGSWRGEEGQRADMTLVWGVPLVAGGAIVTAELADLAVDQCRLVEGRFTLLAPDAYRGDYLEVKLWSPRGELLAGESLYIEDDGANEG